MKMKWPMKCVNPFPNTPFWDPLKFKEAIDDNWNVAINAFPKKPCFLRVWNTSFLKTLWEKEKFFPFPSVFIPFGVLSASFHQI